MSMNNDTKGSGCCGGNKKTDSHKEQQPDKQATTPDKANEFATTPPQKPVTPQSKPKSCCE